MGCVGLVALICVLGVVVALLIETEADTRPPATSGAGETAARPQTPTPAAPPTPRVAPADFEVLADEFQQGTSRWRAVGDIVIQPDTTENTAAALAAATRALLVKYPEAKVGVIFGYSPGDNPDLHFTRGVSYASRDGKGWTGDGEFTFGVEDDGQIAVIVGHAWEGERQTLRFPHEG